MNLNLPNRKRNRLGNYDYSDNGSYFITICTLDRKEILSRVVGTGVPDCPSDTPKTELTDCGIIAEKYIKQLNDFYTNISVDKYVVMPDHIHLLLTVDNNIASTDLTDNTSDNANSVIAKFIGTFKRYCNKEYGYNIWQPRYYDHVIRNQKDYNETCEYIDANPINWVIKNENQDT